MEKTHYRMFLIMLSLSFLVMYTVMFLNVDQFDHVYLSTTRLYMTMLMVSPMALIMLLLMGKMYTDRKLNTLIIVGAVVIFGLTLTALRTQTPIADVQYMKAMIPHHSSAIMVSQEANIKDPELKKLSEEIIRSQEKEIAQMKKILERMQR